MQHHNPQLDLAHNFVQFTNRNIFLTGKAGTGKTTFLHNLKKNTPKRMAIVAPTGVAAINAGGVTIHSFFQLPFSPYIPDSKDLAQRKLTRDKINLIRSLDLLIIDEISMVRADTLDQIDAVMRRFKDRSKPFGGVQLLMIGDLHQLSPVIKEDDWRILKDYYPNLYFFSSRALQQTAPVSIELKHIYRQADTHFIDLLNSVRDNIITPETLEKLNQRHIPDFRPDNDAGYITLTTHNQSAQQINEKKLNELSSEAYQFKAEITGDFPEYSFPTESELTLKSGAQVMFVKNDSSREKQFYNGKIGKIVKIKEEVIYVQCPGDQQEIAVSPLDWNNIKFALNEETKEIEETVVGSFKQYPLKLAWAITIHKSQGLTFERAVIDAAAAFAHGQVYVALSRCKTLEGMVLSSPIDYNSVKTDSTVSEYTRQAEKNAPDEAQLTASKIAFQQSLLLELFDFKDLKTRLYYCRKTAEDHSHTLEPSLLKNLVQVQESAEKEIYTVADSFKRQLHKFLSAKLLPEQDEALQERVKKAANYFEDKYRTNLLPYLAGILIETDSKKAKTDALEAFEELEKTIQTKLSVLNKSKSGFNTLLYLHTKANAEIDFKSAIKKPVAAPGELQKNLPNAGLYALLKSWRDELATEQDVIPYQIIHQKVLRSLAESLPATLNELEGIKGMGKVKVKQFGAEILNIISRYCEKQGIVRQIITLDLKPAPEKTDTKQVTLNLFKEGKNTSEIAAERNLTINTIEGHLTHFISTGEIDIFTVVSPPRVNTIMEYLEQHPKSALTDVKIGLGDDYSYNEIKAVISHLQYLNR